MQRSPQSDPSMRLHPLKVLSTTLMLESINIRPLIQQARRDDRVIILGSRDERGVGDLRLEMTANYLVGTGNEKHGPLRSPSGLACVSGSSRFRWAWCPPEECSKTSSHCTELGSLH